MNRYVKCVYYGYFDPFTYKDLEIIEQAALLFDEVHILICTDIDKPRHYDENAMRLAIKESIKEELDNPNANIIVTICNDIVANYCLINNIEFIIKGLADVKDYVNEERSANFNDSLKIKTIYFRAKTYVSSTLVREFIHYNNSVIGKVPSAINRLINRLKDEENKK